MKKKLIKKDNLVRIALWLFSTITLSIGTFVALNYAFSGNTLPGNNNGVATGSIKLDISPRGSYSVYLNESIRSIGNGDIIDNIHPGKYKLRIQKEGYNGWEQNVVVSPGLITDVFAQLFPASIELQQLTKSNLDYITFSRDGKFGFYLVTTSTNSEEVGLWKYGFENGIIPLIDQSPIKVSTATELLKTTSKAKTLVIKPSPNSNSLLLKLSDQYFILDANSLNPPSDNTLLDIPYPIQNISWLGNGNLLVQSDKMLIDYNITNKTSRIIYYQAMSDIVFAQSNDTIYLLNENKLFRYRNGNFDDLSNLSITFPKDISGIRMATNESNKFVVSNTNGNFYIDLDHNKLVNIGSGEIISISPNSRNIILKRNENLFSIKINYSLSRVKLISNETPISYLKPVNWETTIWSHNSNYFVFQYLEDTAVYSADNSGNNVVKIIDAAQLTGAGEYVITPDNLNLVIRLTDSNKNTTLPARTNLYKIGFVR